jgi:cystathionine beta-lyase/cystathionine gamma-synthase
MTSGTKYIGGHGDTTLGMLATRDPELGKRVYFLQVRGGGCPSVCVCVCV